MKLSVTGAGAIGSMFGGLVKHHDPDIDLVLIARGDHGRAMSSSGKLRLTGPWPPREVSVKATENVADVAGSNIVLLTVKSQAATEAMEQLKPHLGEAIVVSIQNGVNHRLLLPHVPSDRLVMGMTATNMMVAEPGVVSLQLDGATFLGPPPGEASMTAVENAASVLQKSGLRIETHPRIVGAQYNKLAINVRGYTASLSRSNFITEALAHREWRQQVARPLLAECRRVFDAAGIELVSIPGVPSVDRFGRLLNLFDRPLIGNLVGLASRAIYNRRPIVFSLQLDLEQGKPTEVDYINGHVVELAEAHGIAAPYNAKVVELTHALERRGPGSFYDRKEVIRQMMRVRQG